MSSCLKCGIVIRFLPKFWKAFYSFKSAFSFVMFLLRDKLDFFRNISKKINVFFVEDDAQISVELIIVLAAVVAVVLVLVSQLQSTSAEGSKKLKETSDSVFRKIENIK